MSAERKPYWLTKFGTVSGIRSGHGNRIRVQLLDTVPGTRGKVCRVMLPHGVVGIAPRSDLTAIDAEGAASHG